MSVLGRSSKSNNTTNNIKKGLNGNNQNVKDEQDKKERKGNTKIAIPLNSPYNANINNDPYYNNDLMNQQIEEENIYYQQQLQCQEKVNIQLLLRRQKHYDNTFRNCYDTMKEYIKNPTNTNKGNFLWNLDCCVSMVSLWKNDYPEYTPQFSKKFNKERVIKEINQYIQHFQNKNDIEHLKMFAKFSKLLNNERQNMEDDRTVLNYFPEVKANENNTLNGAHNLIEIKRKIDNETETEEFYGFPNFEVDDKIKHLRKKDGSS